MSRSELAERTKLSNSTISSIVKELLSEEFIFEKEIAASNGGRKPIILSLNSNASFVLTFRFDKEKTTVALINFKLEIVDKRVYAVRLDGGGSVARVIKTALEDFHASSYGESIAGVGMLVPGIIDAVEQKVILSTILNLKQYDLAKEVHKYIDREVFVYKSSDAELLGERLLRNLDKKKRYIYLVYETGLGCSFISKDVLFRADYGGMEIGHTKLNLSGNEKCSCGLDGCIEAYVSETAAIRQVQECIRMNDPNCPACFKEQRPTLKKMLEYANAGNRVCSSIMEEQCRCLGIIAANLATLFSPDKIIISATLNDCFLAKIVESYKKNVLYINRDIPIELSTTSLESGCIGIANEILNEKIFKNLK